MFEYFTGPSIKQGPTLTEITGMSFKNFNDDIVTQYGTSTPGKYMFQRVNSFKMVTHNFYLLELELLLKQILQSKNIWSNRRDIHTLQTKLRTETWIKDTQDLEFTDPDVAYIKRISHFKPYPDQIEFLRQYPTIKNAYKLKGLLLDAKPGSGKTAIGLMWGKLNLNGKHIIVCPKAVIDSVWLAHIERKFFKEPPKVWSTLDGTPPDPKAEYYIFHNDFLINDLFFKYLDNIFSYAGKGGIDLVIDECHNFNDLKAQQTRNLIKAVDKYPFNDALPMSGTPLKAQGKEAYTVFACIDNFFKGSVRESFLKSYGLSRDKLNALLAGRIGRLKFTIDSLVGVGDETPMEYLPVSFKGAEQFTLRAVKLKMLTYIKDRIDFYEAKMPTMLAFFNRVVDGYELTVKDNMSQLSEVVRYKQIVNRFRTAGYSSFTDIDDSKFCKRVEEKIEARLRGDELKTFRNVKSAVKYVGLKIRGEALGNVLGKARREAIQGTIEHAGLPQIVKEATKKTLIFTSYVDVLETLMEYFQREGFNPVSIYGANSNDRDANLKKFSDDYTVNPTVTTFDSLGEGVPVLDASTTVFMNPPWRDYELTQAKARTHRQGQDTPTRFIMINLNTGNEPNITTRSLDIMEWSREQTEILLGEASIHTPAFRTVMGTEDYWIIDETPTSNPLPITRNAMHLF